MRVKDSIKLLSGAKRWALYDFSTGSCVPIGQGDLAILNTLASGRDPISTAAKADRSKIVRKLVEMRVLGWIESGSPMVQELALKAPTKSQVIELEHIWIELTNTCNLQCDHCYAESGPNASRFGELTDDEWKFALKHMLMQPVKTLTFIGGEPLVRFELLAELARIAHSLQPNLVVRIFSNLAITAAVNKLVDFAQTFSVNIGTSLYGTTAHAHDKMTKKIGSWSKTIESIVKLRAIKVPIFVGYFCLENESRTQAETFLHSLGITHYKIQEPSNVGRGAIIQWKQKKRGNILPKHMAFNPERFYLGLQGHNCFQDHFSIRPDGTINPCIMARDVNYGNIKNVTLSDIRDNSTFEYFSGLGKDNIAGCADCEFRYACFDCRPDARGATSNWKAKPDCGYDPTLDLSFK